MQEVGLDWGGDVALLRGQKPLGTEKRRIVANSQGGGLLLLACR